MIKKEKAIKVQPNRATIGNGPSFGWVFMADFLTALAKKVKTNTATVENYRCIYVPPGIPLRREKDEPLRVNVLFKHIQVSSIYSLLQIFRSSGSLAGIGIGVLYLLCYFVL